MKVSVGMITYNHEKYIAQAIESVLVQQTDFAYEFIIGEDCSTDGTRAIVCSYGERYPEKIRLLLPEKNLGGLGHYNFVATLSACHGQYIAFLEGDDYWTDPLKLQKQVDFLEAHPKYVMCFHNTMIEYEDGSQHHLRHVRPWDTCTLEELIINFNDFSFPNNVTAGHTSSMVFRNGLIMDFPSWFPQSMSGDLPWQILLAQYGKAKFIDEVMSVHRIHPGGISSAPEHRGLPLYENRIRMYEGLKGTIDKKFGKALDEVLVMYYTHVGDRYRRQLKFIKAYYFYKRAFGNFIAFFKIMRALVMHFYVILFKQSKRQG